MFILLAFPGNVVIYRFKNNYTDMYLRHRGRMTHVQLSSRILSCKILVWDYEEEEKQEASRQHEDCSIRWSACHEDGPAVFKGLISLKGSLDMIFLVTNDKLVYSSYLKDSSQKGGGSEWLNFAHADLTEGMLRPISQRHPPESSSCNQCYFASLFVAVGDGPHVSVS
ncbi:hypothetical protein SDJN03_20900, partial [Cucurbita argyrosperma subsp. sororia]